MTGRALGALAMLSVCVAAAPGCAQFKQLTYDREDLANKQEQRAAEAIQTFDVRRDSAQFLAAQARWREGNLPACREALGQLLSRNPKLCDARLLLAQVHLSDENFDQALEELNRVIAEQPDNPHAHHMMGLILQAQGQESEALAHFQRAAEREPENPQFESSCADAARNFESPAVGDEPVDPPDSVRKASVSMATTEPSQSNDPPNPLVEAQSALAAGDLEKAGSLLSAAISRAPDDPMVAVRAAVLALRHEQPDLAVELLERVIDRFSDSAAAHRTLGTAYYRQGNYRAAQAALERAIFLDKADGLTYLLVGCTLEKLGQSEAAKTSFEQAARLDPRLSAAR